MPEAAPKIQNCNLQMKTFLLYAVFPMLLAMLSMVFHPARAAWTAPLPGEGEVTLTEVLAWKEPVLWIDARVTGEYQQNHIPGAISLNDDNFESELASVLNAWQPGSKVIVYCDTQLCDASHAMAERLRNEVGIPEVWILYGGWRAWVNFQK